MGRSAVPAVMISMPGWGGGRRGGWDYDGGGGFAVLGFGGGLADGLPGFGAGFGDEDRVAAAAEGGDDAGYLFRGFAAAQHDFGVSGA